MVRSHPPTLLKLAERTLVEECGVRRGQAVLLAVSGGADSQAMLHVLSRLAERVEIRLIAVGVDHGLRAEAAAELELARRLAASQDVPFEIVQCKVKPGGNLQARARRVRYGALRRAAGRVGATWIATAHHADDRAETVLMRILSGATPAALAVIPPRHGDLIRPLVRARRRDVLAHLSRHRVDFATDPSNADRRFLRVRVRHELMPVLEGFSPAIVEHLNALADDLGGAPGPEAAPVVRDATGAPVRLARSHVAQIRRALRLGQATARVLLPGGLEVVVGRGSGPELIAVPTETSRKRPGSATRARRRTRRSGRGGA